MNYILMFIFIAIIFCIIKTHRECYESYSPVSKQHPDGSIYVADRQTGQELIPSDDISLSPGFGVGEGTYGFGRFGSTFMA